MMQHDLHAGNDSQCSPLALSAWRTKTEAVLTRRIWRMLLLMRRMLCVRASACARHGPAGRTPASQHAGMSATRAQVLKPVERHATEQASRATPLHLQGARTPLGPNRQRRLRLSCMRPARQPPGHYGAANLVLAAAPLRRDLWAVESELLLHVLLVVVRSRGLLLQLLRRRRTDRQRRLRRRAAAAARGPQLLRARVHPATATRSRDSRSHGRTRCRSGSRTHRRALLRLRVERPIAVRLPLQRPGGVHREWLTCV